MTNETYRLIISMLGWTSVCISLFWFKPLSYLTIAGLLILFLCICESFPIPSGRGTISLSFPILFTLYLLEGLSFTAVVFSLITLVMNNVLFKKQYKQSLLDAGCRSFNLIAAILATDFVFKMLLHFSLDNIMEQTLFVFMLTAVYFLLKKWLFKVREGTNFKVSNWFKKDSGLFIISLLSFVYCWLLFYLSHQYRKMDVLSFFFFFSPLVGLTIVSATIVKLEQEKQRLKALFSISNEYRHIMDAFHLPINIINELKSFLPMDASILWLKDNNGWNTNVLFGEGCSDKEIDRNITDWFHSLHDVIYLTDREKQAIPATEFFGQQLQSFIFSPLYIEQDIVGVWGIGHYKNFAFTIEDIQSVKAITNQMALMVRTKILVEEQEKHKILEERSRIARELHDGIAQRIAGAVMNLEAATKSFDSKIDESKKLVQESLEKLRGSLKDIRESIYALRPHPVETVGIIQALKNHIDMFKRDNPNIKVSFQKKGKEDHISHPLENVIFNVFKEALRNIEKHAQATSVNITLNYKENQLIMRIKDNGLGFSLMDAMIRAKSEPHFGIINMHELADSMGATLEILSKREMGTEIILVVPKTYEEGL